MTLRALRVASLVAASGALPACLEADIETEIRADGSGTFGASMKFTEKTVEVIRRMREIDPAQDIVVQASEGMIEKPSPEKIAEMEKGGLKVLEADSVNDEKRLEMKVRVEFRDLAALKGLDALDAKPGSGSSPADDVSLTRDEKGIYTLALHMSQDGKKAKPKGEDALAPTGESAKEGEAKPPKDPEEEAKKQQKAMALTMELMGEASKLRIAVTLKVPGEIVDFAPAAMSKKDGNRVTWTMTFQSMMEAAMGAMSKESEAGSPGGKNPMEDFQIRFRLPEGQSISASALTPSAPPAPAPAATPPAPPAPGPEPGEEGKKGGAPEGGEGGKDDE